eukprot:1801368-Pyramimonas_sp.AAC.1
MRSAARGLELMEADFHWDIACLQEFTDALEVCEEVAGHRLIPGPPVRGRKSRPAIIVHKTLKACIIFDPSAWGTASPWASSPLTAETSG